jgi:hypothetical protein
VVKSPAASRNECCRALRDDGGAAAGEGAVGGLFAPRPPLGPLDRPASDGRHFHPPSTRAEVATLRVRTGFLDGGDVEATPPPAPALVPSGLATV